MAHQPIDLARPKANYNKTPGYTQDEIDGMGALVSAGLPMCGATKIPNVCSTHGGVTGAERARRTWAGGLDYFMASDSAWRMRSLLISTRDVLGSDHCPVGMEFRMTCCGLRLYDVAHQSEIVPWLLLKRYWPAAGRCKL